MTDKPKSILDINPGTEEKFLSQFSNKRPNAGRTKSSLGGSLLKTATKPNTQIVHNNSYQDVRTDVPKDTPTDVPTDVLGYVPTDVPDVKILDNIESMNSYISTRSTSQNNNVFPNIGNKEKTSKSLYSKVLTDVPRHVPTDTPTDVPRYIPTDTPEGRLTDVPIDTQKNNKQHFYVIESDIKIITAIMNYIRADGWTPIISQARLSQQINISQANIRKRLRRLKALGIIITTPVQYLGNIQGNRYKIDDQKFNMCINSSNTYVQSLNTPKETIPNSHNLEKGVPTDVLTDIPTDVPKDRHADTISSSILLNTTTTTTPNELDLNDWQGLDPISLSRYFGHSKVCETIDELQEFLDRVNAAFEHSKKIQKPIRDKNAFLFSCLKAGFVNTPENYVSRKERVFINKTKMFQDQANRLKEAKLKAIQAEFNLFIEELPKEEIDRLRNEAHTEHKNAAFGKDRLIESHFKEGCISMFLKNKNYSEQEKNMLLNKQ